MPDEIKQIFSILSQVTDGVSSLKAPKNDGKGSGKKGDDGNPVDHSTPRAPTNSGNGGTKKKCRIPASKQTKRIGAAKNTMRIQSCVADKTVKSEMIITSLTCASNAEPTKVAKHCEKLWSQACFHYSSAIQVNPQWATLTCPTEAASTKHRLQAGATATWSSQHRGDGWMLETNRVHDNYDRDEFPPVYLLGAADPAYINSGHNSRGQLVRYMPYKDNQRTGQMWKGSCFNGPVKRVSDREFQDQIALAPAANKQVIKAAGLEQTIAGITVNSRPEFSFSS